MKALKTRVWVRHLLIPVLIIGFGVVATWVLVKTKEQLPVRAKPQKAVLVDVVKMYPQDVPTLVSGYGNVEPRYSVDVQLEVSGRVVALHPQTFVGGVIPKGEVVVQLDPRQYELMISEQQAAVVLAEAAMNLEQGKQVVAKREWGLLRQSVEASDQSRQLALRVPQFEQAQAGLAAARSRLEITQLNLEHTTFKAPFDALVLEDNVNIGQYVTPQMSTMRLVSVDEYQVIMALPQAKLDWLLTGAGELEEGAHPAMVYSTSGVSEAWSAKVVSVLGAVEQTGRLAQVLVSVPHPRALHLVVDTGSTRQGPAKGVKLSGRASFSGIPLLLGSWVRVEISGPMLKDVFVVPEAGLREGDKVWIVDENNFLRIRQVEVILAKDDSFLISNGLQNGDRIVVTPLSTALDGMLLRVSDDEEH